MDADLYEQVMAWKRKRPPDQWHTPRDTDAWWFRPQGYTQPEICLRADMAANKAAWTGDMRRDLWLWTKNTNPIAALCYSHQLHPISRLERCFILLLQILLFAYIAIVLTRMDTCETFLTARGACSTHVGVGVLNEARGLSSDCCAWSTLALARMRHALEPAAHRWWAGALAIYLPLLGLTAAVTLLNVVLSQLWFLLAGCACCQRSPRRHWWECVGSTALVLTGVAPLAHIWWLLTFFAGQYLATACRFVVVKLVAVCGSTLVQTVAFLVLWRAEMYGDRGQRLFVSAQDTRAFLTGGSISSCRVGSSSSSAAAVVAPHPHAASTVSVRTACL